MTKIFYFSGTGNSLWSAKKIAEMAGGSSAECEILNIGKEAQKENIIIEVETVVFVFPSYAYGLPVIVRRFVKNAVFKTNYIASFVTYGSNPGGTLGEFRRILKKKGIGCRKASAPVIRLYFGRIPSVENYLALFGALKPEKIQTRLLLQNKATEEAACAVNERRENKVNAFTPFSSFVSFLFSLGLKVLYKAYKVSGDCNGCGFCKKICPVSAIHMENNRPVFTKKCEHCQGCVDMCPLRAIQFGRVKWRTPGYKHPEVNIAQ